MSKVLNNIKLAIDSSLEEYLRRDFPNLTEFRILRKSVDARRSKKVHFVYSVEVATLDDPIEEKKIILERVTPSGLPPVIIGAGPAGLFAALRFVERGVPCILFERGSVAEKRIFAINRFWRYGELDPNDNVCFGEGGAGLYSDGKLITRIKSEHIPYVMHRLVKFGAPSEIIYTSNPHVGSDKIRRVIPRIRQHLIENGCQIHFNSEVKEINFENKRVTGVTTQSGFTRADKVILATGHSADEIIHSLHDKGVDIEGKSYAIGIRIEHPQETINKIQYRSDWQNPNLGSANYRLAWSQDGIGVYSFCMCPGGYVLSSGTEPDGLVCNGMSNFKRGSKWANSAIVVSIDHEKRFGRQDVFAGMRFRRELEQRAFQMVQSAGGSKQLPAQMLTEFLNRKPATVIKSSSPSGVVPAELHNLFATDIYNSLCEGIHHFEKLMKGFISDQAMLYGIESRTSCPVRIVRDKQTLMSTSHSGLYPCGEGAGYAGGITSAACDGIKIAEAIIEDGQCTQQSIDL